MEEGRNVFVLIRMGYEFFLIPREGVLIFFKIDLNFFDAASNIYREVLTEGQAQDKSLFCIFSYSMAKSPLFIHSMLMFMATLFNSFFSMKKIKVDWLLCSIFFYSVFMF